MSSSPNNNLEPCKPGWMWLVQSRAEPKGEWHNVSYSFYRYFAEITAERFEAHGHDTSITLQPYNPWCLGERELIGSPALPTV